jgi:hypothetical protein
MQTHNITRYICIASSYSGVGQMEPAACNCHVTVQEYEQQRSWLQCVSKLQDLCPGHDKFDMNLGLSFFLLWICFEMTNKLHLPISYISGICVCAHNSGVNCDPIIFCFLLGAECFCIGGGHCNISDAAVQNVVARSSGFVHHTISKEFPAFSYYAKLPLVLRLYVPIGAHLRLIHTHVVPMPFPRHAELLIHTCHAAPLPCSNSAVSFVKVCMVARNIRTASPSV